MSDSYLRSPIIQDLVFPNLEQSAEVSKGSGSSSTEYKTPEVSEVLFPTLAIAREVISNTLSTRSKQILGAFTFGEMGAIAIGKYELGVSGDIRLSPNGIVARNTAGENTIAIDGETGDLAIKGTILAGSVIAAQMNATQITGQIVNAQIANLAYAKITDVLVTSAQIESLSADKISAGTINASVINVTQLNASNLASGDVPSARMSTNFLAAAQASISTLSAITANIGTITAGSIAASLINSGTLTVGGTSAAQAILLRRDNSGLTNGSTYLRWEGGSRIWSDSSDRIGINSIGSPMYIYVASSQRIIIPSSGQTTIEGGAYLKGNFNVADGWAAKFTGEVRLDTNYIRFSDSSGAKILTVNDMGVTFYRDGDNRGGLSWGNGADLKVDQSGKWFKINGNAKEAIVPTSDGYKALYCIESPEVWFMDFCQKENGQYKIDPMFLEVTVGPYRYVKTEENGIYQVWGKRKGHDHRRFEDRSTNDFKQNEKFLTMRKAL